MRLIVLIQIKLWAACFFIIAVLKLEFSIFLIGQEIERTSPRQQNGLRAEQ